MLTTVLEPRYRWEFAPIVTPGADLAAAAAALGLSPLTTALLAGRGVGGRAELEAFFAEPIAGLHDPRLLPDADRAKARIERAREQGERVLVFGDFDADGLTGLAILVLALERLGIEANTYVPSRLEDGHGLSLGAVDAAARDGIGLIVTVDTGSSSVREVASANDRGIDVIVTDHHRVPPTPPEAYALVNPQRTDAAYPDRRLAGSGVAFKLAQLLLADAPGGDAAALDLADLATIGTVADLAPVLGENRSIARLGLELLRRAPRPGLAALLATAHIPADKVDLEAIAFHVAPRLNAAGRVGAAADAARLLLATDAEEAATLAAGLETDNLARRDLTKKAVADARAVLAADGGEMVTVSPGATVVHGPWPVGIVGLVAARLVEETGLPAVVGADLEGAIRGSCRSNGTLDLGATLEACASLLVRYGGHPGAAGFEIETDRWEAFRDQFLTLAATAVPRDPRRVLRVDLALPGRAIDYTLLRDLSRLGPTGPGHPEPLICVCGLTVTRIRSVTGGHTQITLRREPDVLDGIAFGREDLATMVSEGDRVDVVARVASRTFGGYESIQLEVRDVALAGSQASSVAALAERFGPTGARAA